MGRLNVLGGQGAPGALPGPIYEDSLTSERFDGVSVKQWMWSKEGLGLRPGIDLMVYAVVYAASRGGGLLACTCSDLASELGCMRETVQRSITRLVADCLIWSPTEVRNHEGGRPVKCYCCCQGTLARVGIGMRASLPEDEGAPEATPAQCDGDEHADIPGFRHEPPARHETCPEGVENLPAEGGSPSRNPCGQTSRNSDAHIGENHESPAETSVFDPGHISTYTSDMTSEGNPLEGGGDVRGRAIPPEVVETVERGEDPLLESDVAAFGKLVRQSLLPVDEAYLAQNLVAFKRLVEAGVPSDVILVAYGQYANYQHERRRTKGEWRPMHLLNWLTQRPNENIRHVLRQREEQWRSEHRRLSGAKGRPKGLRPTHESPRIERCLDHGKPIYFVTDDRGGRLIRGSRGVESPILVLGLYEHMYDLETLERRRRGQIVRGRATRLYDA